MNYSTTEREALAVVWAVEKFRGYLEGAKIFIATDHQPLKWLFTLKTPTGRLARCALRLQPFDLQIDYTPGKRNVVADMLLRPTESDHAAELWPATIHLTGRTPAEVREEQVSDPDIKSSIIFRGFCQNNQMDRQRVYYDK